MEESKAYLNEIINRCKRNYLKKFGCDIDNLSEEDKEHINAMCPVLIYNWILRTESVSGYNDEWCIRRRKFMLNGVYNKNRLFIWDMYEEIDKNKPTHLPLSCPDNVVSSDDTLKTFSDINFLYNLGFDMFHQLVYNKTSCYIYNGHCSHVHTLMAQRFDKFAEGSVNKLHMYLYPLTVVQDYAHDLLNIRPQNQNEILGEVHKDKDYLATKMYNMRDRVTKILDDVFANVLGCYYTRRLKVIYHFNCQNIFEDNRLKNDTIIIHSIKGKNFKKLHSIPEGCSLIYDPYADFYDEEE